jgi:purine-cytosine permease-like protein
MTGTFVVLSQVKINVTNAYAGSIAWSNFFSRLTHSHPGRVVWLVFNVMVALLLMEIGVYKALEQTLALYSNVAIAWVGALVADLVINKPLGLRPRHMEFKRAHLYDINPVGVGAMTIATIVSISAFYGLFGPMAKALSPFVALLVADYGAADRLGYGWKILHRAKAQAELAEPHGDPVLHLRAFVRAGGYGIVSRLCRPDLLAMLLARCALP